MLGPFIISWKSFVVNLAQCLSFPPFFVQNEHNRAFSLPSPAGKAKGKPYSFPAKSAIRRAVASIPRTEELIARA